MKAKELRDKTVDELKQLCEDTEKQVFDLRAKTALGEGTDQPLKIRELKRDLARIKTVMTEQESLKDG
jgi:large subunit ribosomal protein L29